MMGSSVHIADLSGFGDEEVSGIMGFFNHLREENSQSVFFLSQHDMERMRHLSEETARSLAANLVATPYPDGFMVRDYLAHYCRSSAVFCYSHDRSLCDSIRPLTGGRILFHIHPQEASHESLAIGGKLKSFVARFFPSRGESAIRATICGNEIKMTGRSKTYKEAGLFLNYESRRTDELLADGTCFNLFYAAGEWAGRSELRNLFRGYYLFCKKTGIRSRLFIQVHPNTVKIAAKLIGRYKLEEDVVMLQHLSEQEKYEVIRKSDVVLSLPVRNKFSRTVLNCVLLGKPVVINRFHINSELSQRPGRVFCIDSEDSKGVYDILNELYWEKRTGRLTAISPADERRLKASWIWKLLNLEAIAF